MQSIRITLGLYNLVSTATMSHPYVNCYEVAPELGDIYGCSVHSKYACFASSEGSLLTFPFSQIEPPYTALKSEVANSGIHAISTSQTSKYCACVTFDGNVVVFDLQTGSEVVLKSVQTVKSPWSVKIADEILFVASLDADIVSIDIQKDEIVSKIRKSDAACLSIDTAFNRTEVPNVVETKDKKPEVKQTEPVDESKNESNRPIMLLTAHSSNRVRITDVNTERVLYTLPTHVSNVRKAVFSDSQTLACVVGDKSAALYVVRGAQYLGSLVHDAVVYDCAFSSDDSKLATVDSSGTLRVYDVATLQVIFKQQVSDLPLFCVSFVQPFTPAIQGAAGGVVLSGADGVIRWFREA